MTNKDRLITLLSNADNYAGYDCELCGKDDEECKRCVYEKLAEYLLAKGVIVLPCKVGDVVYKVEYCRCGNPEAYEMKHCHKKETKKTPKVYGSIMLRQDGKRLIAPYKYAWKPIGTICYKIIQKPFKLEWLTEISKTIFLTKEEAERELERLRNEQN